MVKKMNKEKFLNELSKQLDYSNETCIIINNILEENFFLSKSNKEKIIEKLKTTLEIEEIEASKIYDTSVEIIKKELAYKVKHPLGGGK